MVHISLSSYTFLHIEFYVSPQSCDLTGLTCYEGCKEVVETIRTTHPCFVQDLNPWLIEFLLPEIPADVLPVPVPDTM